jgi:hypothetical protein
VKFRKKPVVIEAIQYTGQNNMEVTHFASGRYVSPGPNESLLIYTLEGTMEASKGDWIIKGVKGECYPCKPDIFEATYEPVKEVS